MAVARTQIYGVGSSSMEFSDILDLMSSRDMEV